MTRPTLQRMLPDPAFRRFQLWQTKARSVADILRPGEHIFYQSHMRAYTTLTSHILATSPEISGYVELHRSYRHPADLVVMRHQIQALSGAGINRSRYVLDKLLHDGNGVSEEVGQSDRVKSVFAMRHPGETLPSIVKMVERTGEKRDYGTPAGATEYYVARVARLAHEAEKAGASLYFDAETIVDDTDRLLGRLTTFLGLSRPLQRDYATFDETGTEGAGDPSTNIHSGTILRTRERPDVIIPAEMIDDAVAAYHSARERLIRTCTLTVTNQGALS